MEYITIFIGHIRPEVTLGELVSLFLPFGEVHSPRLILNRQAPEDRHPNGPIHYNCAFLEMQKDKGERAIAYYETHAVACRRKRLHIHKATGNKSPHSSSLEEQRRNR